MKFHDNVVAWRGVLRQRCVYYMSDFTKFLNDSAKIWVLQKNPKSCFSYYETEAAKFQLKLVSPYQTP